MTKIALRINDNIVHDHEQNDNARFMANISNKSKSTSWVAYSFSAVVFDCYYIAVFCCN